MPSAEKEFHHAAEISRNEKQAQLALAMLKKLLAFNAEFQEVVDKGAA